MLFSRIAAKQICELATSKGFVVWRYEGGIFREDGKFQARLDAIWDRHYLHEGPELLEEGNLRAANAIDGEAEDYNAFVITAEPLK